MELERVLRKMRDPTSHESYLALVQKSKTFIALASNTHFEGKSVKRKMSCKPFNVFWNMMSGCSKHFSHVATENSLIKRVFSQEYETSVYIKLRDLADFQAYK